MDVPKDGVVSFEVDAKSVNRDYYQSIAYPVFGSRAIRIDMLDRVISAIYDSAQGGKFRAQHKMAEWLGSTIDGLYDVLKAMGHNKIEGSAASEQPVQDSDDTADVVTADDLKAAETKTDNDKEVEAAQPEEAAKEVAEATKDKVANEQVKPDLAEFYLKKGKAFQRSGGGKKNFKKNGGKDFKSKGKKPYKKSHNNKEQHRPRVISTGPEKKLEDSPFAILEQLKNSKNE